VSTEQLKVISITHVPPNKLYIQKLAETYRMLLQHSSKFEHSIQNWNYSEVPGYVVHHHLEHTFVSRFTEMTILRLVKVLCEPLSTHYMRFFEGLGQWEFRLWSDPLLTTYFGTNA
jgi:hypothetical protein